MSSLGSKWKEVGKRTNRGSREKKEQRRRYWGLRLSFIKG
jgi:hypothetical protein